MTSEIQAAIDALPETETLRDEMAMAALPYFVARMPEFNGDFMHEEIAECSYRMADAMMAARQKGGVV